MYVWLDEALTYDEANARCSEGNNGELAVANSKKQFEFLRGMYDEYRSRGGNAVGAWIEGKYDNASKIWRCKSNYDFYYDDACRNTMPWTHGEPNRIETEWCILVWYSRTDGVANFRCYEKMPAICAINR